MIKTYHFLPENTAGNSSSLSDVSRRCKTSFATAPPNENPPAERHFKVHDCIFTGNTYFTANGGGTPVAAGFLDTENVRTAGTVKLEKDQGRNNYLQLKEDSFGTDLTAGLFKK